MYFFRRFLPLVSSSINSFLFLILFFQNGIFYKLLGTQNLVYTTLSLSLIVSAVAVFIIGSGQKITTRLRFFLLLLLNWFSGFSIFLFSEHKSIFIGIIILIPFIQWIWLENLFFFWQQPVSYHPYSLQKLANYLYIIAIFLFVTGTAGLHTYLQIPFYMVIVASSVVFFYLQIDQFLLNNIAVKDSILITLIGTMIATEFFLVNYIIPTQFFLYGLSMAVFFYIWNGVARHYTIRFQRKLLIQYISIGTAGLLLAFITSFLVF